MSCSIMIFENLDGLTAAAFDGQTCNRSMRVSLFGSKLTNLNLVQRFALVDLLYRRPGAHLEGFRFYDGDLWAKSGQLKELP
jgi:hypothetical protein